MVQLCLLVTGLSWNFCMTKDSKIWLRRWWCWLPSHNADTQSCGRNGSFSILCKIYSSEEIGSLFSKATPFLPFQVTGTQSAPHLEGLTWDIDSWGAGLRQQEQGRLIPFVAFSLSFYTIETIFTFFNSFSLSAF